VLPYQYRLGPRPHLNKVRLWMHGASRSAKREDALQDNSSVSDGSQRRIKTKAFRFFADAEFRKP